MIFTTEKLLSRENITRFIYISQLLFFLLYQCLLVEQKLLKMTGYVEYIVLNIYHYTELYIYLSTQVGCIFVTTLLHYLFLSVFCWTLCEGIIMFIMFYSVFYHGFFQRMYFYLIIGWGKYICRLTYLYVSNIPMFMCTTVQASQYHQLYCQLDYHTKIMEFVWMIKDWRKQFCIFTIFYKTFEKEIPLYW